MAVADIFSALTEDRPYRKGLEKDKVIEILLDDVKKEEIDGDIVNLLIKHYDEINQSRKENSLKEGKRYYERLCQLAESWVCSYK